MCRLVRKAQHNTSPRHHYVSSVSSVENSEDGFSSLTSVDTRPRTLHYGTKDSSGGQTIIDGKESRQRQVSLMFQHNPVYDLRTHLLFI